MKACSARSSSLAAAALSASMSHTACTVAPSECRACPVHRAGFNRGAVLLRVSVVRVGAESHIMVRTARNEPPRPPAPTTPTLTSATPAMATSAGGHARLAALKRGARHWRVVDSRQTGARPRTPVTPEIKKRQEKDLCKIESNPSTRCVGVKFGGGY